MDEVLAPVPGKITKLLVKPGDNVQEDDQILLLEAMKMENPIFATSNGKIKEIRVKEGQDVDVDQVLLVIE
ncbi:MAG TPA: acetyl-CoA carboxylase biotin carboxyl carrier protein subunit [Syntrophales bacterium]|jgi:biotin carboxyl carrier protein|nr:acetyl-CoA carboxylase biotin carboxyl carrier protein subunit [Syntrophales bacterium]HOX94148.1 acetyl-CoA carboxylase biotin carboxyl carrier protein subunit [Syntrophales bacterium]HPN25412.1 acetyl-CoA carboxylase biotin carboxyl carrier protein subunit [Syntrophales bacterium]HQM29894.1 acetyl-CoA carboxylase biotin carboxyl carrier protein subunit [Syntrophales bacterium]